MKKRTIALHILILIAAIYVSGAALVQRFKCPSMTEMQVFLALPDIVQLKFHDCENHAF